MEYLPINFNNPSNTKTYKCKLIKILHSSDGYYDDTTIIKPTEWDELTEEEVVAIYNWIKVKSSKYNRWETYHLVLEQNIPRDFVEQTLKDYIAEARKLQKQKAEREKIEAKKAKARELKKKEKELAKLEELAKKFGKEVK